MRVVVALGGNALQKNNSEKGADAQLEACMETAGIIADLIEDGHEVAVVHGNGPQVGEILMGLENGRKYDNESTVFPLDVCGSFTQGYIGYHLQNTISYELKKREIKKNVLTIVTQVVVDEEDKAFKDPSKPIGSFYTYDESKILEREKGYIMKEDSGRGYRRVVPSPKPIKIVEGESILKLIEDGNVIISCGGGGIPVVEKNNRYIGVEGVIDKDFASSKLANEIKADMLLVLTAVDKVAINYNTPSEKKLESLSLEEIDKYIDEGHFPKGSMLPKIEASKEFVKTGKVAIISSLSKARGAILGEDGTKIYKGV